MEWTSKGNQVFNPLGKLHLTSDVKGAQLLAASLNEDLQAGVEQSWQGTTYKREYDPEVYKRMMAEVKKR